MKNRILKVFGIAVIIILILMIASSITKEHGDANNPNVGAINQIEDEQVETNIEPDAETVKEINDLMWENLGTNLLECGYDEESGCYMIFLYVNAIDNKYQANDYKINKSLDNLTKCVKESYGVDCAAFLMDSFTVSNIIYSTINGKEINIAY